MADTGILSPEDRVELIDGEVITMSPRGTRHATGVSLVEIALQRAFRSDVHVRNQQPLALGRWSEPEPDLAVVAGTPRDYRGAHPSTALLVVEVADTSLAFDRGVKGPFYAGAGVADYWIVNLAESCLEVYRDPAPGAEPGRWAFRTNARLVTGDTVSPLAAAEVHIAIEDLLP